MPSNYTQNYQLNQWSADDRVQRSDFNADNAKIDAALAGLQSAVGTIPKIAVGTYTGDGAASRFFSVGFTPKAVLIVRSDGRLIGNNPGGGDPVYGGLAVTGQPVINSTDVITIVNGGFRVAYSGTSQSNQQGRDYNYIAFS